MKFAFTINYFPVKRGNAWVVQIFNSEKQLDSEVHFKLKREAQTYIDGWANCVETHSRS